MEVGDSVVSSEGRQLAILERVARGAPLPEVLSDIVLWIEAQSGGMLCSILLIDVESHTVQHMAAPHLPAAYTRALDGSRIGPEAGSCGSAAFRKERVIVEDIATHPYWVAYRDLALPYGIRACWSSPVFSPERQVLGTFAMYYRETRGPLESEMHWVEAATHLAAVAIQHDYTQRALTRSEARARQLARLYAVSSSVNEAMVRLRDPDALYQSACRIAVEGGLARLAWVGLLDEPSGAFRPVARCGADDGYVDSITLSVRDERSNRGPAGRAVASAKSALSNDIEADADFFWKEEALSRGLRSCAVFPLQVQGKVTGVFAIYAAEPHCFQGEEIRVLEALAADISFAVESAGVERERSRMQQEVQAAERLRQLIYRSVADVIFCLSVREGEGFRFLSINPAFQLATGLAEEEVIGKTLEEVLPSAFGERTRARCQSAIETRMAVSWEDATETPVGVRHGELTVAPVFDETGRCTNLVGTVRDVTPRRRAAEARRRLEHQLQQAQRLQSLGTLAGGVAHDFNNILTAIGGNAELGLVLLPAEHEAAESFSEIRKATRRAVDLVRQILSFSRQASPTRRVVDAGDLIEEVFQLLAASLPSNVHLASELAGDTPKISADPSQLHQVFMNLCTNAAHALLGKAGTIRVSSERHVVGAGEPPLAAGCYARITVRDTGCGMDEATLARAFEPFFTTRAPGQGTGLGLSVVHGILQSHGGHVTVQSAVGEGTTFQIHLPAADTLAPSVPAAPRAVAAGGGEHILYVDDEEALVFLAQRRLSQAGYRVTGHSDALRALADFRGRAADFDAVVTDISMPGLSGHDLVRELRQLRPELPIVMTSGYIRPEDIESAERLGVRDLILKPDTIDELVRVLQERLDTPGSPRRATF